MTDFKSLPVYKSKQLILDSLEKNNVIIVESPTGSGKTTQIPIILHEAGYDERGIIGITQPRRIATLNVSSYISRQIEGQGLSEAFCAYKMRFYDTTDPTTRIKILTDGMLLQELKTDSLLSKYSVIMVDEAHERSLNIDFILGLLKDILKQRNDLKVIISSATINTKTFSKFFGGAPIITINARVYDVDIKYYPPESSDNPGASKGDFKAKNGRGRASGRRGSSLPGRGYNPVAEAVCNIINRIVREFSETGFKEGQDTLVFLPGEADIKETYAMIYESCNWERLQIYPLYSRLNKEEQERVFEDTEKGKIKVVLATNIAETSLTINGIKAVIDSGLAKINYYNQYNFTSSLVTRPISRSSAMQRAGRAGRTSPGVCYRLYTQKDFESREMYTEEEILRTDLSEVVLRMVDLGIKNFEKFSFITKPGREALASGEKTLRLLDAITPERELTPTGSLMVAFPLLPRHSKCIVHAIQNDIDFIKPVAVCVSFLSCKSPYLLPVGFEEEARNKQKKFHSAYGDFIGCQYLYEAYTALESAKEKEDFCNNYFLDIQSMEEVVHVAEQLCDIAREAGIPVTERKAEESEEFAHRLLANIISGLVQYVCIKKRGSIYSTPSTDEILIHPGSAYFRDAPEYIVAGEIVQTSRMYARTVSPLKAEWIQETLPALAKAFAKISNRVNTKDSERRKEIDHSGKIMHEGKMLQNGVREGTVPSKKTYTIYGLSYPVIHDGGKKNRPVAVISAKDVHLLYKTYMKSRRHPKSILAAILYKGYYLSYGERLYEVLSAGHSFDFSKELISDVPEGVFSIDSLNDLKKHLDKIMLFAPLAKYKDRLGYISLNLSSEGYIFRVEKNFSEAINNSAYALLSISDTVKDKSVTAAYNRVIKYLD